MHRQLRSALQNAEGMSDLVVVIFLDVRGFSNFAGMAESSEAAIFLRRMYLEILEGYFPDSAFFKPTGDGLMIIRHFERDTLEEEIARAISRSLDLVENFPEISAADPMVNFDVPISLGVGIARGAATRLASGDLTLDYSGRPLNLAARLMDLARPSGVVFDGRLIKGVDVDSSILDRFNKSDVYLKGIADRIPIDVFASDGVSIPARNTRPLEGEPYESKVMVVKFKDLVERGRYIHKFPVEPIDPSIAELVIRSPVPMKSGAKGKSMSVRQLTPFKTRRGPSGWEGTFDYTEAVGQIAADGVKSTWEIRLQLRYMSAANPAPPCDGADLLT